MIFLAWTVATFTLASWIMWAVNRHYDALMYHPDKKIRPLVWSILTVMLFIAA